MATDEELRKHYSSLSPEFLLKLASERSTLTESAQIVLDAEMRRRDFSTSEIAAILAEPTLWEKQAAYLPIAMRVNGCGTTLIGRRDVWPDGSYITQKWITILFVPVFRVATMRVRQVVGGYLILEQK
jgi:hypothetical protein